MTHGPTAGFANPLRRTRPHRPRHGATSISPVSGGFSTEWLESRLFFNTAHEAAALAQTHPTQPKPAPVVSLPSTWQAKPIALAHYFQNGQRATNNAASDGNAPNSNYSGSSTAYGLTPSQMRGVYGVGNVSFGGVAGDGTGQTIAIVDAYDDPNIASDLHNFDVYFGLPDPPSFTKLNQTGGTTLPGTDLAGPYSSTGANTWEQEESLDVEWAHVIAPKANIILYEAMNAGSGLYTAVSTARATAGVTVVSMSWGGSEFSGETYYDGVYFTTPSGHIGAGGVAGGITFVASTGDSGAGLEYPAASANVVAVGGTSLTVSGTSYVSESGWSGSGGGISSYESQPSYQTGVVTQSSTSRTVPDVSLDADPNTGVPIYDSWDFGASTPWVPGYEGGTSLAAPMWAGLVAVADQGRALAGLGSLNGLTQTLPRVYKLPASDFHDITSGNNGYAAGTGYDLVTGRGTPIANTLVPDLAGSPVVTGLTVSPSPVPAGGTLTLTATGVSDPNSGGTVSRVAFYEESNSTAGLQTGTGGDTLIGTATSGSGGSWLINVSTTGFATGSYTFYAVATDNSALASSPATGIATVQLGAPAIGAFLASPNPVAGGNTFTLSASGVSDPNAGGLVTGVNFYLESNGTTGLQTGTGGDTLLGTATSGTSGTWALPNISTSGLASGTYTCYAVATDNFSASSAVASATETVQAGLGITVGSVIIGSRSGSVNSGYFDLTFNVPTGVNDSLSGYQLEADLTPGNSSVSLTGATTAPNAVFPGQVPTVLETGNALQVTDSLPGVGQANAITNGAGLVRVEFSVAAGAASGTFQVNLSQVVLSNVQGSSIPVGTITPNTITVVDPAPPVIGGMSASPSPVPAGNTITLSAGGVTDPNTGGSVSSVAFYRESNGTTGLQTGSGGDTLLGTATSGSGGVWSLAGVSTTGMAPGSYTYYAVASDNYSATSAVASAAETLSPVAPTIGSLAGSPNLVAAGSTFTLSASAVADPNTGGSISSVAFYRESNGTTGLQTGSGGDTLLGTATSGSGGAWSLPGVSTTGMTPGSYTYYAVATDNYSTTSAVASTAETLSPVAPTIGSLAGAPNPVAAGSTFTLSASGVADPNTGGSISSVAFYRESNGTTGLQTGSGGDTLLGTATSGSGGAWSLPGVSTTGMTPGSYTYYAVATDNYSTTSAVASTAETLSPVAPTIGGLAGAPNPVAAGSTFTLSASGVADPNTGGSISSVTFYRESNGTTGLQTGSGGDTLLGTATSGSGGVWSLPGVSTTAMAPGSYTYYAVASDNYSATSAVASTAETLGPVAPTIGSLAGSPNLVAAGSTFTLSASAVADPNTGGSISSVAFYRESNGTPGLQTGSGGDTLLGTATSGSGGVWSLPGVSTTGLAPGSYTYYAVASDNYSATSAVASTAETLGPVAPTIGSLAGSPNPVAAGTTLTLSASGVADPNTGGSISSVTFYRESNGTTGLQTGSGGDTLLGTATSGSGGVWSLPGVSTTGLAPGSYTYYAVATDNYSTTSAVASTAETLSPVAPTIGSLAGSPNPVAAGSTFTLSASGVADPNTGGSISSVAFYRESNGTAGLQTGSGGDTLLGTATSGSGGVWSLPGVSTTAMAPGSYTYYAVASDNYSATSAVASTAETLGPVAPTIGSLAGAPNPVAAGSTFTLSASGVADPNTGGSISSVTFYRESNGTTGLQTGSGGDTLLGTATSGSGGVWSLPGVSTTGLAPGSYIYYAVATDNYSATSAVASTAETLSPLAPTIGSLAGSPNPIAAGSTFTLSASAVADPNTGGSISSVTFYRESNGTTGLQTGSGGDTLLGTATSGSGGVWSLSGVSTTAMAPGSYTYYAVASDNYSATSAVASAAETLSPVAPTIGSLAGSPNLVAAGSTFTLSASAVADPNTGGSISSVAFYRESNGTPGLQTGSGGDTLLGTATSGSGGVWSLPGIPTTAMAPGSYTYYAVASDNYSATSAVASTAETLGPVAPTIGSLAGAPNPLAAGSTFTLSASGVADPNTGGSVSSVAFYRESNGTTGLQTGSGGDTLLGTATSGSGGVWSLPGVSTAGMAPGSYTYYAVATDNYSATSAVASTAETLGPVAPTIGSLAGSPNPVAAGSTFTLSASGVADRNPGGSISSVAFYRESNGTTGLQTGSGGDTLLGTATSGSGGVWSLPGVSTTGLAPGSYTYYAVATDNYSATSAVASTAETLSPVAPTIGSLAGSPNPVAAGSTFTLSASGVADPNTGGSISSVAFYLESNGTTGLQTGSGGDTLLGTATSGSGGVWSLSGIPTTAMAPGSYTYYAVASDNYSATSAVASTAETLGPVAPTIGSLAGSPNPVAAGSTFTLSASAVADPNTGGSISSVAFYRESNGTAGLQTGSGGDTLLGTATSGSGGVWSLAGVSTAGLAPGSYTYYAVATDNYSAVSAVASTFETLSPVAPTIGSLAGSPNPVAAGSTFTLSASGVADPNTGGSISSVAFYRESNGTTGLQTGSGGDTLLGTATSGSGGVWSLPGVSTAGMAPGSYTYYAVATDNYSATSAVASTAEALSPVAPTIGSLAGSPNPVAAGSTFTLRASGVADPNPGGSISSVAFYRESNGTTGLQTGSGGDTLLGTATSGSGGVWSLPGVSATGLAPGSYIYYAVATDNYLATSAVASTAETLSPVAPTIGSLAGSPNPVAAGSTFTLSASGVADPNTGGSISSVAFYRESNGTTGLQTGSGGDTLLGTATSGSGGVWSLPGVSTAGMAPGSYTYYVVATDNYSATSAVASTAETLSPVAPTIGSLAGSPNPVAAGSTLTLSASGVADPNPGGSISSVTFYRESNGTTGLQTGSGGDTLLGTATSGSGGVWSLSGVSTTGLAPGSYIYYAVATGNYLATSAVASTAETLSPLAPTIDNLAGSPNPVAAGSTFTLSASGVADPNTGGSISSVAFYLESNGTTGLQTGSGGDTLLGTATSGSGGTWSLPNISTAGLTTGTYTYYAVATDNFSASSDAASTTESVEAIGITVGNVTIDSNSKNVETGYFDLTFNVPTGLSVDLSECQIEVNLAPGSSGITLTGASLAPNGVFTGQTPTVVVSGNQLEVTDLLAGGDQVNITNGAGLCQVQFSVAVGTASGAFQLGLSQIVLSDAQGNPITVGTVTPGTISVVELPEVTGVSVSSSTWSSSFPYYGGYAVPSGAAELTDLPWINLDTVSISFNEAVNVTQASLAVAGVNVPSYASSGFSYNTATDTATWTFPSAFGDDKLLLALASSGANAVTGNGLALDGEWASGTSTFPSGDGTAGGDFDFNLNILPGDVDSSGSVNVIDVVDTRNRQFTSPGSANYSPFFDVDGSGAINVIDTIDVRNRQFTSLPSGNPIVPQGNDTSQILSSHSYTVTAFDAAKNASALSGTLAVKTPDTTPPSTPMNLKLVSKTSTSVTLSWTASTDNVSVQGYDIYRNGVEINQVGAGTTTYTDKVGLSPNKTYSYSIVALDEAGNRSARSAALSLTTPAAVPRSGTGLTATYYKTTTLTTPVATRVDPSINFNWGKTAPVAATTAEKFSVQWLGQVQPRTTQTYTFYTTTTGGVRVWVNGKLLINNWAAHGSTTDKGTIALVAGQKYNIEVDYFASGTPAACVLDWSTPTIAKSVIPASALFPNT